MCSFRETSENTVVASFHQKPLEQCQQKNQSQRAWTTGGLHSFGKSFQEIADPFLNITRKKTQCITDPLLGNVGKTSEGDQHNQSDCSDEDTQFASVFQNPADLLVQMG